VNSDRKEFDIRWKECAQIQPNIIKLCKENLSLLREIVDRGIKCALECFE
jgi:hypothetical protein